MAITKMIAGVVQYVSEAFLRILALMTMLIQL